MTKASANPRRYSKGPETLDPNMPLNVYMSIRVDPGSLDTVISRLEYLADKHEGARIDVAAYRRNQGHIMLTLEVYMGPARSALRGTSMYLQTGYALLWDIVKTLFNYNPILCGPPSPEERASVALMGQKPNLARGADVRAATNAS